MVFATTGTLDKQEGIFYILRNIEHTVTFPKREMPLVLYPEEGCQPDHGGQRDLRTS